MRKMDGGVAGAAKSLPSMEEDTKGLWGLGGLDRSEKVREVVAA